jgi:hypothetical protein
LTIDRAVRTGAVFIGTPASDSTEGSNPEAKPVSGGQQWFLQKSGGQPWFESSVPGGSSSIDNWDRLSSDTLNTYRVAVMLCSNNVCASLLF